jgi:hypothetical protein
MPDLSDAMDTAPPARATAVADVYCIGTYKCATTYLYEMVKQHPQVHVPDFKEVHFFSTVHGDGLWERRDWDWYGSLYAGRAPGAVAMEFSPGYMIEPDVAGRLATHAPHARLVSVIRDPVERVRSHYHYLHNGKFPLACTLDELVERPDEFDPPGRRHILGHGLYHRNVQPFLARFGRERLHFVVQETLRDDPAAELAALFRFMGVDEGFVPARLDGGVNTAQAFRSPALYWAQYRVATLLERHGLSRVRRMIKSTGLANAVRRANTTARPNPPLTDRQRDALRAYYADDVARLSALVDDDLAARWWRAPRG